jgi:hypothetical protein
MLLSTVPHLDAGPIIIIIIPSSHSINAIDAGPKHLSAMQVK